MTKLRVSAGHIPSGDESIYSVPSSSWQKPAEGHSQCSEASAALGSQSTSPEQQQAESLTLHL